MLFADFSIYLLPADASRRHPRKIFLLNRDTTLTVGKSTLVYVPQLFNGSSFCALESLTN